MIIPWRLVWTGLATAFTAALALVLTLTASATNGILITICAAGAVVVWAHWFVAGTTMWTGSGPRARKAITRGIGLAVALHALWIVTALILGLDHFVPLAGVLVTLAAVEYAAVIVAGYLRKRRPEQPALAGQSGALAHVTTALARAGHGNFTVTNKSPLGPPDAPHGIQFDLRLPAGAEAPTTNAASEKIAIALSETLNTKLQTRWVQLRKTTTAGEYALTVVLRDVMDDVIPYIDNPTPASITTPVTVGYGLNGSPTTLVIAQHGQDIGMSRAGKSCLINVKIAHLTRSTDAITWVAGAEKLYDLVAGWLEPYMGTDYPIPFDWVATGQQDVLNVLIAAMNIARWRQRQPLSKRVGWPHIVIILDEASFALRNRAVTGIYQGQTVTAAQMAAMISQGAGSANVWLLRASQRSTNDHAGDQGGDTTANVGYSAAFQSRDWAEIGRLMGDYTLPAPTHKGEYWLDAGTGEPPILLKAPYIQEVDPSKPVLHQGPTVSDIAWARRNIHHSLDEGSTVAAGDAYRLRLTRMGPEMLEYLTGEPPIEETATVDPHRSGYDAVKEHLTSLPSNQGSGVAVLTGRKTRTDRVVDIVTQITTDTAQPATPQGILDELKTGGDITVSMQLVTNALTKLVTDARLVRVDRGQYVPPGFANTHTVTGGVGGVSAGQDPL